MISRAAYRQYFRGVLAYDLKASKSPVIVFSTLTSDTAIDMAEEMEALAKRSKRVQKPCAHFCFSLAPGEFLTAEQWSDFFAAVVEEFGALQAVGITHADTPQSNAHLVMNRVKADGTEPIGLSLTRALIWLRQAATRRRTQASSHPASECDFVTQSDGADGSNQLLALVAEWHRTLRTHKRPYSLFIG